MANEKRRTLYLDYTGDMTRTQILLAFIATGRAGQLIDMIDDANRAGVESARDIADAIRYAAKNAGIR